MLSAKGSWVRWSLIAALAVPTGGPSYAQDAKQIEEQMGSINGAPVAKVDPPEGIPTTVPKNEAVPFTPEKDETPGVLAWFYENSTPILTLSGAATLLSGYRVYDAMKSARAFQADWKQIEAVLPDGVKQRLRPQLDRVLELNRELVGDVNKIGSPALRANVDAYYGIEGCALRLEQLSKVRASDMADAPKPRSKWNFWSRNKPAPEPPPAPKAPEGATEADLEILAKIQAQDAARIDAHNKLQAEVRELERQLRTITGSGFKVPEPVVDAANVDMRGLQGAVRRVVQKLEAIHTEAARNAGIALPGDKSMARSAGEAVGKLIRTYQKDGLKGLGASTLSGLGQGLAWAGSGISHPLKTTVGAFGFVGSKLAQTGSFVAENREAFTMLAAALIITSHHASQIAKKDATIKENNAQLLNSNRVGRSDESNEISLATADPKDVILATTQVWNHFMDIKELKDSDGKMPFNLYNAEGVAIGMEKSATARKSMKNLQKEIKATMGLLGTSDPAVALWVNIFERIQSGTSVKTGEARTQQLRKIYADNKRVIDALSDETNAFAENTEAKLATTKAALEDTAAKLRDAALQIQGAQTRIKQLEDAGPKAAPPAVTVPNTASPKTGVIVPKPPAKNAPGSEPQIP